VPFTYGSSFPGLLSQDPERFFSQFIRLTNAVNQIKYGVGSEALVAPSTQPRPEAPLGMEFRLDGRVYNQAARNAGEVLAAIKGVSTSLSRQAEILVELKGLAATASSNGTTLDSRVQLNASAAALVGEYNALNSSTAYNKLKLMSGAVPSLNLQLGYGENYSTVPLNGYTTRQAPDGYAAAVVSANSTAYGSNSQGFSGADVNGDGRDDVLIQGAPGAARTVAIAITTSAGISGDDSEGKITLSGLVNDSALVDVDGDGKVDVLAATSKGIEVAYGNGDGRFSASSVLADGAVSSVSIGDINGDGTSDIAAVSNTGDIHSLIGSGARMFSSSAIVTGIASAQASAVGDVNGDGYSDIAIIDTNGDLYSFLGAANGTLSGQKLMGNVGGGVGSYELAVGEFNGDGLLDYAVTGSTSSKVIFGQTDRTVSETKSFALATGASNVTVADLNGDGRADIAARIDSSKVAIYSGSGDGDFSSSSASFTGSALGVADLNGDGAADLVGRSGSYYASAMANTKPSTAIPYLDLTTKRGGSEALEALSTLELSVNLQKLSVEGTSKILTSTVTSLTNQASAYFATADKLKEAYTNRYLSPNSMLSSQARLVSTLLRTLFA
jgi:hypothetical protein